VNFSPIPRIAPPPFGSEILGADTANLSSACFLRSALCLSSTSPPFANVNHPGQSSRPESGRTDISQMDGPSAQAW
jgi:hypothetical protein